MGGPNQAKEILKIGACLSFFLQVLKQMTRNVTGFFFILEIKMTIRWRVEECGGVGDGGVLDE